MTFQEIIQHINENFKQDFVPTEEDAPATHMQVSSDNWKELAPFLRNDDKLFFDSNSFSIP